MDDFGLAMLQAYRNVQDRLLDALLTCANGKRLTKIGFHDDVVHCAQTHVLDLAPWYGMAAWRLS